MQENSVNTTTGNRQLSSLKNTYTGILFPAEAFFSTLFFTGYYLGGPMVSPETLDRIHIVYILAVSCHFIMLPGILLGKRQFGQLILLANLCWIVVSRCLLKDYDALSMDSASHKALIFCCFYACGWVLDEKKRALLTELVTAEVLLVLSVWGIVGIATALCGHSLPGFEQICLKGEFADYRLVSLSIYTIHRNKSATYFVCAAGLCLYQCVKKRSVFWKLCTVLFLPLAFCTAALLHSRSNYLAFAVVLALTAVSLLWDTLRWTRRPIGIIGEILAAGMCALMIYASFAVCSGGLSRLAQQIQAVKAQPKPAVEMTAEAAEVPSVPEAAVTPGATEAAATPNVPEAAEAPGVTETAEASAGSQEVAPLQIIDKRDTLRDATTFTIRVNIWKALLRCIRETPQIGLLGQPEKTMMKGVRKYTFRSLAHLHNILFQQLGLAGFPGMLLYILWLLSMAKDMIICFFVRKDRESRAPKVLCAILLSLLAYGVFEPLMSFRQPVSSMMFCLIAGLLAHISVREDAQQTESV